MTHRTRLALLGFALCFLAADWPQFLGPTRNGVSVETGLLPTWDKYIDKGQRDALGFKYDPAKAKSILDAAGYKKGGDGFYTNKDGSPIKLTVMVPTGWSDWEASRDVIIASLKAVGINA